MNNLYPLTKSMELSKITTNGQLFYIKKFLAYYDIVFVSKKLDRESLISFKEKWEKLNVGHSTSDKNSFFRKNFLDNDFISFDEFGRGIKNKEEILSARKLYFSYLISFESKIKNEKYYLYKEIIDNKNVKKGIVSFKKKNPTLTDKQINSLKADIYSFSRNERQLLYLWGFLISIKPNGEFFKISPIGNLFINSNYITSIILYEWIKINQTSRNPFVSSHTQKWDNGSFNFIKFPYIEFLKQTLTQKNPLEAFYVMAFPKVSLKEIKEKVAVANIKDDLNKEYKKLLQGITFNGYEKSEFQFFKYENKKYTLTQPKKLNEYIKILESLKDYIHEEKNIKIYQKYQNDAMRKSDMSLEWKAKYNWTNNLTNFGKISNFTKKLATFAGVDYKKVANILRLSETWNGESHRASEMVVNRVKNISIRSLYKQDAKYVLGSTRNQSLINIMKALYISKKWNKCESCGLEIKYNSKRMASDLHHVIPIHQSGPDVSKNLISICQNCHKMFHDDLYYEERKEMYINVDKVNYFRINIKDRVDEFVNKGWISTISLMFLLNENLIVKEKALEYERRMYENS